MKAASDKLGYRLENRASETWLRFIIMLF